MVQTNNDIDFYLIRHGHSLGQAYPIAYQEIGDHELPLTTKGVDEAIRAADFLAAFNGRSNADPVRVYNGESVRTSHSAHVIKERLNTSNQIDTRLNKQVFGEFDGLLKGADREYYKPAAARQFKNDIERYGAFDARPKNGESIADVYRRTVSLRNELLEKGESAALVTHGLVGFCFEAAVMNHGPDWIVAQENKMPNMAIIRIHGNPVSGFQSNTIFDGQKPTIQQPIFASV